MRKLKRAKPAKRRVVSVDASVPALGMRAGKKRLRQFARFSEVIKASVGLSTVKEVSASPINLCVLNFGGNKELVIGWGSGGTEIVMLERGKAVAYLKG